VFPTILAVDDESAILQSLSGILSDEGFEVLTASNGYEALKIIEAESPDLVLRNTSGNQENQPFSSGDNHLRSRYH